VKSTLLLFWIFCIISTIFLAKKKGRSVPIWLLVSIFLGVFGVIGVLFARNLKNNKVFGLNKSDSIIASFLLVILLILTISVIQKTIKQKREVDEMCKQINTKIRLDDIEENLILDKNFLSAEKDFYYKKVYTYNRDVLPSHPPGYKEIDSEIWETYIKNGKIRVEHKIIYSDLGKETYISIIRPDIKLVWEIDWNKKTFAKYNLDDIPEEVFKIKREIQSTDNKKNIKGYLCKEVIAKGLLEEHYWVAKDIVDIRWFDKIQRHIAQAFSAVGYGSFAGLYVSDLGGFPLHREVYDDKGQLIYTVDIADLSKASIPSDKFELPAEVNKK